MKVMTKYVRPFKVWFGPLLLIKILLKTAQPLSKHFPSGLSLCILYQRLLTIITKRSILDVAAVLDPPLPIINIFKIISFERSYFLHTHQPLTKMQIFFDKGTEFLIMSEFYFSLVGVFSGLVI